MPLRKLSLGLAVSYSARVVFTVKETEGGVLYAHVEVADYGTALTSESTLFDFPPGTDLERASETARFFNENIAALRIFDRSWKACRWC